MEKLEHWVGQMELVEDSDQTKQLQGFLEDRGNEGWELVSVTLKSWTSPGKVDQYTMFFKRRK